MTDSTASRAARAIVGAVQALVVAAALYHAVYDWGSVVLWLRWEGVPRDPDAVIDAAHPGYRSTVAWVRAQGLAAVRALYLDRGQVDQRLIEMMFPIPVEVVEPSALRAGDVVVVFRGTALPVPVETRFEAGQLAVVQVR